MILLCKGGPGYQAVDFDVESMSVGGRACYDVGRSIARSVCYYMPRNCVVEDLLFREDSEDPQQMAVDGDWQKTEFEFLYLNGKCKALCAYYGALVKSD